MYLTKLRLDIRRENIQKALGDCSEMHRDIQRMFGCERKAANILYRLVDNGGHPSVYIYSDKPLNADMVTVGGYSWVASMDMTDALNSIKEGDSFRFELVAYPSKKVRSSEGHHSKRVPIKTPAEQIDWLLRQANNKGFRVLDVTINKGSSDLVRVTSKVPPLRFKRICFAGVLEVIDRDAFKESVCKGIGPEKAYGMGMLMLV